MVYNICERKEQPDAMQTPLEIVFRDVEKSEELEALIESKARKLERVCDFIISCRVAVEKVQRSRQSGHPIRVRLDVRIPPGKEVVVSRTGQGEENNGALPALIRDAFETARLELLERKEKVRGAVKARATPAA